MNAPKITGGPCTIDGCERQVVARGWCGAHYAKWQKYGDPFGTYLVHGNIGKRYLVAAPIPLELHDPNPLDIAWAVGLFEGEGSVVIDRSGSKAANARRQYASPRMQLNSTDRDVVERFRVVMGGRVNHESQERRRKQLGVPLKDQWKWILQGYEPVSRAWDLFEPWLAARRREQFAAVFAECDRVRGLVP